MSRGAMGSRTRGLLSAPFSSRSPSVHWDSKREVVVSIDSLLESQDKRVESSMARVETLMRENQGRNESIMRYFQAKVDAQFEKTQLQVKERMGYMYVVWLVGVGGMLVASFSLVVGVSQIFDVKMIFGKAS
jgi:hypothetical protein